MTDNEYLQALHKFSTDRQMEIPESFFTQAMQRIKDGVEPVVAETFNSRPTLEDCYDVALRLYQTSFN